MRQPRSPMLRSMGSARGGSQTTPVARRALIVLVPLTLLILLWVVLKSRLLPTSYPWRLLYAAHDFLWLEFQGHFVTRFGLAGKVGLIVACLVIAGLLLAFVFRRSPLDGLHLAVIRSALVRNDYHGFLLSGDAIGRGLGLGSGLILPAVARERERATLTLAAYVTPPRGGEEVARLSAMLNLEWALLTREPPTKAQLRRQVVDWYLSLAQIRDAVGFSDHAHVDLINDPIRHLTALVKAVIEAEQDRQGPSNEQASETGIIVAQPEALSFDASADLLLEACLEMGDLDLETPLARHTAEALAWLDQPRKFWERLTRLGYRELPDPNVVDSAVSLETTGGLTACVQLWLAIAAEAARLQQRPGLFTTMVERLESLRLLMDWIEPPADPSIEKEKAVNAMAAADRSLDRDAMLAALRGDEASEPMHPADQLYLLLDPVTAELPARWCYQHSARLQLEQSSALQHAWQTPAVIATGILGVREFSASHAETAAFQLSAGPSHFSKETRGGTARRESRG